MFLEYFAELATHLRRSYPNKKLVVVMDNLHAHKTSFILKIMEKYPEITILYTPAQTPQ